MTPKRRNTLLRARDVQDMVMKYHAPGRNDRSKSQIYRHYIYPAYRITQCTFFRYLSMDTSSLKEEEKEMPDRQQYTQGNLFSDQ